MAVAVGLDLAALDVFKYYSFFAQQFAEGPDRVGLGMPLPLVTITLPVGISFFTFQAISYVVDVNRLVEPASLMDCAVYLIRGTREHRRVDRTTGTRRDARAP